MCALKFEYGRFKSERLKRDRGVRDTMRPTGLIYRRPGGPASNSEGDRCEEKQYGAEPDTNLMKSFNGLTRDAGVETAIGNHSFRAIGITDYLERGGDINIAKRMAGHSNVKTTELYDRRGDEVSFSEIERVGI